MKTIEPRTKIALVIVLICWLIPSSIFASVEVDGIYYDLNTSTKTASVVSNPDRYTGAIDVPSTITFNGSTYSVKSISSRAFLDCSEMTSISFPSSVTTIGSSAFERCTGLTDVVIGSGVTFIDYEAFGNCSNLTCLTLPSSLKTIENETFSGCNSLERIIAERTTPPSIVNTTFNGVDKSNCTVYVPVGCQSAYANATNWKTFSNIVERTVVASGSCGDNVIYTIYSDMTMVVSGTGPMWDHGNHEGDWFWFRKTNRYSGYYSSVKKTIIEEGVTTIGNFAFYDFDSMTSLTIPNTVTTIGDLAFSHSDLTSIAIPNSVTRIGCGAFYGCSSLYSLFIPANVSIIESDASFYDLGSYDLYGVFCNCRALETITVDPNNPYFDSRDACNAIVETSTNSLIAGCSGTIIPNSVTKIADYAFFNCEGLISIDISNSVVEIGENAFYNCWDLTSVTIPSSVTAIGSFAFYGCTGLSSISVENEMPISINNYVFEYVDKSICKLYVPAGSKTAYENAEGWKEFQNIVEYDTDISALDNAIYVDWIEGRIGRTMDIPVKVKNSYDFRGFQFTLELPEGTTINSWKLSADRLPEGATLSDMIATKKIEGNKIQVACSLNYGNATFTGNDGEIATVNVTFSEDMEVGEYPIYLTACDISDAGGTDNKLSDIKASLVLEDYVDGDANGDGEVLIGDVIAILNYIVGVTSDNFNMKAADANGDGEILIGDVIAVLNIIVGL